MVESTIELPKDHFLFTSESVAAGHPDKMCDIISDSILDACLAQDKHSKVACETAVKNNLCMVFGEISTKAKVSYEDIVRNAIKEIGYDSLEKGMDFKSSTVICAIDTQSPEIFQAVIKTSDDALADIGAGDQGLMIGYATDETPELMPLSHILAQKIIRQLYECRTEGILPWLRPDAKSQVTVQYKIEKGQLKPVRVHTVLISTQHTPDVTNEEIAIGLKEEVIKKAIPSQYIDEKTKYFLNPSGKFIIGGPTGDAGCTGRKIIVDTYGGWGGHGGGAFSGKDPTKVDRSAAYAARWVAKSLVANKLCKRCMVQIAYGIGVAQPISLHVDSYGSVSEGFTDFDLSEIASRNFDLRPGYLMRDLKLLRPIFKKTACYGHFGRIDDEDFSWEIPKDLKHELEKKNK